MLLKASATKTSFSFCCMKVAEGIVSFFGSAQVAEFRVKRQMRSEHQILD
jgi:hypothetical protein